MKKMSMSVLFFVVFLVLVSWAAPSSFAATGATVMPAGGPSSSDTDRPPPTDGPRSCPSTTYIDCMPPVKEHNRTLCSPEYLKWMEEHCPGVKVVY